MSPLHRYIGKLRQHKIDALAAEYRRLAEEDEAVGRLLLAQNRAKHAAYCFIQAMEKVLCSKILQNSRGRDVQDRRSLIATHRMDDLVNVFVEACLPEGTVDQRLRDQIKGQIHDNVLQGLRFGDLHNNLRYPKFIADGRAFGILEVAFAEADFLLTRLEALKAFARDVHRAYG